MKDQPPDFEDRWKEPQHGIRGLGEACFAEGALLLREFEAGSWTSEDEVQVTEDRPRPPDNGG
jgi:hypothetical protein